MDAEATTCILERGLEFRGALEEQGDPTSGSATEFAQEESESVGKRSAQSASRVGEGRRSPEGKRRKKT